MHLPLVNILWLKVSLTVIEICNWQIVAEIV